MNSYDLKPAAYAFNVWTAYVWTIHSVPKPHPSTPQNGPQT